MRALILAVAVTVGTLTAASEAQAWTWGRFYGTGYYPSYGYTPSYYPSTPSLDYSYYPSYQNYTYPAYNAYYPGYYNNYNLGYSSGIYAPPYRDYYSPGTVYRGYYRGY